MERRWNLKPTEEFCCVVQWLAHLPPWPTVTLVILCERGSEQGVLKSTGFLLLSSIKDLLFTSVALPLLSCACVLYLHAPFLSTINLLYRFLCFWMTSQWNFVYRLFDKINMKDLPVCLLKLLYSLTLLMTMMMMCEDMSDLEAASVTGTRNSSIIHTICQTTSARPWRPWHPAPW